MIETIVSEILEFGNPTKGDADAAAIKLLEEVESRGYPLEMTVCLQHIVNICERARKLIGPTAHSEIEKLGGRATILGAKIEKAVSVSYDYSADETWNVIKAEEDEVSENRKNREKLLRAIDEPLVTENHGNRVVVNPPVKKSVDTVRVTFS